jgi:hypothetical protein
MDNILFPNVKNKRVLWKKDVTFKVQDFNKMEEKTNQLHTN